MAQFKKTTEAKYWEMLGCLPPAAQTGWGFLVGEPFDHGKCTVTGFTLPRYEAFVEVAGTFFVSAEPMTAPEFRAFQPKDVTRKVDAS